jgi:hypothetical protein
MFNRTPNNSNSTGAEVRTLIPMVAAFSFGQMFFISSQSVPGEQE